MLSRRLRLLVVDDDTAYAGLVAEFVRVSEAAATVSALDIADSYAAALEKLTTGSYDIAFLDYWLGAHDASSLMREARDRGVDTTVIVMTGRGDEEVAVDVMKAGASDYLGKVQVTPETLGAAIRHASALRAEEQQRRQAEAALRSSEERFRALVENSSDAVLLVSRDGRIAYVSASAQRHLGWEPAQMLGRLFYDFLDPDDHEYVTERLREVLHRPGEPVAAELRLSHADGNWRSMEAVGANHLDDPSVGAIVVNLRDLSERHRLEEMLRQAQKMEAVGRLAGGIAHDFNNLLTAILGYCSLLLEEVGDDHALRPDLEEIERAGQRAATLTRQLLAFSRKQMLLPQVIDLNPLVAQMEKVVQRLAGERIEIDLALAPDLPRVRVDPASIEQVLVNLTVNARDAMASRGRITIETKTVELDRAYCERHPAVVPGSYVMLAVCDTGAGMDAATRARVFEPFFTTKDVGKGSGLGLATVYGIVKQSGGYVWVYSEPGHGTVFKVYLPPVHVPAAATPQPADARIDADGTETVLLVEDEDGVRALAREVLRRHGYAVLEAGHGLEALRTAERHGGAIHLLVTDVVMPHMSGRDLAERLAAARPRMKVLFMSGYSDRGVMHRELTPGSAFIQKPFTPESFARKVRRVLDTERDTGDTAPIVHG